ncbi:MAG: PIG-L family deacetylase [Candidatus Lokiarchaeota archaeon]|nr:PIG-L family deacetylase [Candidatus Lokiarchaeota archaeon]
MRFLFVAPHPDDLEFNVPSIMFAIAHCRKPNHFSKDPEIKDALQRSVQYFTHTPNEKFYFKAVSMTRGEMAELTDEVRSTMKAAQIRTQELITSQQILTGKKPDFLGFFDGYVNVTKDAIQSVYNYIVQLQPDFIIGPEPVFVYYDHKDHVNTGKLLYFALKRLVKAKKNREVDITIPKLLYYQSIYNHWWFPRFPAFENILVNALKAHQTQSFTLDKKGIEYNIGLLEKIFKGLRVQYSNKAEALRYQPIPDNIDVPWTFKIKNFEDIPIRKRVVHYILRKLRAKLASHNYSERYDKYFDGKMDAEINATWN